MIQAGDLRCRIQLYELEEVRNVLGADHGVPAGAEGLGPDRAHLRA